MTNIERKPYAIDFEISGSYAIFTDPVLGVGGEKKTYEIPTYESIKGALKSVFWKPTIEWFIDKVRVLNPIRMETMKVKLPNYMTDGNDLAYYTYLRDCRYQVRAHFELNPNRKSEFEQDQNMTKYYDMAKRFIQKGARRDVYFGKRECQADVKPCVFGEGEGYYDGTGIKSFGNMYYGLIYPDQAFDDLTKGMLTSAFWDAEMSDGIISYPMPNEIPAEKRKAIRPMRMKPFGNNL